LGIYVYYTVETIWQNQQSFRTRQFIRANILQVTIVRDLSRFNGIKCARQHCRQFVSTVRKKNISFKLLKQQTAGPYVLVHREKSWNIVGFDEDNAMTRLRQRIMVGTAHKLHRVWHRPVAYKRRLTLLILSGDPRGSHAAQLHRR